MFSEGTWICVLRMVSCLIQDKEADCYSIMDMMSIHSRLSRSQTGLFIAAEDCTREVLRVVKSFGEQSCGEVLGRRVAEKCWRTSGREVLEKCCKEALKESRVDQCWGRGLERSVVERCCRGVL